VCNETLVDRLLDDDADRVVGVERSGVAEKRLQAVIVLRPIEEGLTGLERPAGERARTLLDVVLSVVAESEREEFHHFARIIFVWVGLGVVAVVEPHEHGRIARDRREQGAEIAQSLRAEERVLLGHHLGWRFAHSGGEMIVPEERHLLGELPARTQHPVEPPELYRRLALAVLRIVQRGEFRRVVGKLHVKADGVQQRIDRALRVELRERGHIGVRSAESGAAQHVRGVPLVERSAIRRERGRSVELPGGAKADLRISGRIELFVHGGATPSIA
jgi:hypothetical protein